ncbi:kinase-like domain-containing protein [Aspergillus caelatus]|uniref:Kinase-like domain-containing protein n=1 Tax=Aspergillus caelatus TaxID=61420 RepID=A0A5N6ZY52_9EURO|nr:kinase-like domain-containing protein [Aspergillus caelatus]KAE8362531.1 kinase-like domain-containing protein [Aspergillus caelatus]
MASSLQLGQCLRGQNGIYTIGKQLQETVWLASNQPVIVKSVTHFRLQNERDIVEPSDPPAIVLKYLDDNLPNASVSKRLTNQEIKYVARSILEALKVLHDNSFVHTDIKLDNILVNYGQGDVRFTGVQLADCGNTVPEDSAYAKGGGLIGAPIWRSPEAQLRIGWGTQTDIWSFGALLITLLYGGNFFLFKPDVPAGHDDYELQILQRQCQFFGPFPLTYREICPPETLSILVYIMKRIPQEIKPFSRISE